MNLIAAMQSKSLIENHYTVVQFDTPASGVRLKAGTRRRGFVDGENDNAKSGYTHTKWDNSIEGNRLPPQEVAELFGFQCWVEYADNSAVVPEVEWRTLLENTMLIYVDGGTEYILGRAINWIGPVQTNGLLTGCREFPQSRTVEGNGTIGLDCEQIKDVSAGVAVSKSYVIRFDFIAFRGYANESAGKR